MYYNWLNGLFLEFATDKKAHVVGKPSKHFFHLALKGEIVQMSIIYLRGETV